MATSVYDWMLAQKRAAPVSETGMRSGDDDVLVRILKALDAENSKAPISST